jgi:hypothetical protein
MSAKITTGDHNSMQVSTNQMRLASVFTGQPKSGKVQQSSTSLNTGQHRFRTVTTRQVSKGRHRTKINEYQHRSAHVHAVHQTLAVAV